MTAHTQLMRLLETPLPSISRQRRKPYRPDEREINRIYSLINRVVFDGQMTRPRIVTGREVDALGWCIGLKPPRSRRSGCLIRLTDKWFSVHWLIFVLAHEMCHQYQWDILGPERQAQGRLPLMSHGPSFFQHRLRLAELGVPLLKKVYMYRWFQYQDLKKL
jgi:hypothetical protein